MSRLPLVWTVVALCVVVGTIVSSPAVTRINATIDVSWPNCKANASGQAGIVGVTGGLSFRQNPCLTQEASWFASLALYMNTGYPGSSSPKHFNNYPLQCMAADDRCFAFNYGYNAAVYAVNYANASGVHARWWWLDVETDNSWSNDPLVNRASIFGSITALHQLVFQPSIGIYSYPGQWQLITDNWHNGLPSWAATGGRTVAVAKTYCHLPSFTGGYTWLAQYTLQLDQNYDCHQPFLTTLQTPR